MNNIVAKQRSKNIIKTWLLIFGFVIFVILIGWLFSRAFGSPSILFFAVIFSLLMSIVSFWFSDKMVLKMSGAKLLEEGEHPELQRAAVKLSQKANIPLPRLYVISEEAPNAFATGRSPKKAAIAFTEGLLRKLPQSEIEAVLAHELSHVSNRDMLISTVAVVLVGVISLISRIFLWGQIFGGGRRSESGSIFMIGMIIAAILAPIGAMMLQLAVSRKREFLADATGASITKKPNDLANALTRIASDAHSLKRVNTATAHLYFASPFKGRQSRSWFVKLFMTHPPLEERVEALKKLS